MLTQTSKNIVHHEAEIIASIIVELNCTTEIAVAIYLKRRNDLILCDEI